MTPSPRPQGCVQVAPAGAFATTHWSVIQAAADVDSPQAQAALEKLCQTYWYPLYVYVRRRGHPREEAEDLTQEFFSRLLSKRLLGSVKRERGKFRCYLLNALKWFLANEWRRERAEKRGGFREIVSIDEAAERRYHELAVDTPADLLFEREWTWTVLNRVADRLAADYTKAGKSDVFEALQGHLPGGEGALPYDQLSTVLRMKETAVRMAVHRLRRRYGQLLRMEIAQTVSDPESIDEELRSLMAAAGS